MRRLTLPLALAAALCVASCTDDSSQPLDPSGEIPVDLLTPSLTIVDGNNGEDGNEHFFWLKPIGSAKRFDGIADPSIFPTVVICERVDIDGCDDQQAPLATYQRNVGEDKDRIRLDGKDEYFVHWRMKDYTPERDGQYRIRVMIQGHELGHADVIVLRNREIRAYVGDESDELIPVSDRGSFKVSFRIEEGALASQFCDFDGDEDVADCAADQEIAGDGIDTQIQVTSTEGGTEVVAVITAPDGVFTDINGDTIAEVVISAEVEILPPSFDVFTNDDQEIPVFVEVNTFPSDVYIDPNGPGVDVVICQDETVLAARGITPGLHSQLILYKVGDNGITRRLVSTPVACAAPIPAPPAQGFAALLRRGMDKVRSIVGPQPVVARRRLHGGLNTVITRDVSLDEAFSTFGAALGPNADSSEAILPANGDVGMVVPITIQVRNALGQNFAMGGDTLDVTIIGGPNAGATVTVVDNANGIHSASYTPTAIGLDSISIVLIRADGVGLGPIGGSPYTLPILGPMQVLNTADSGLGSLRDAMNNANAAPGEDTITFAIPGPGPHVIALATELPNIIDAVVIDGTSQPGYAGVPVVEVNGASVTPGPLTGHGFAIQASNTEVSGLAITQHPRSGIFVLNGLSNVRVVDNYIGTDAAGSAAKGNTKAGVLMRSAGSLISGNLISGNAQYGVRVDFPTASGNTIENNTIGLDPAGTAALPNAWSGIGLWDGSPNTVIQNNTISGNDQHGIDIRQTASQAFVTGTQILGNTIGLDINGDLVRKGPADLIQGATNFGPTIRGNAQGGIRVRNAPGTVIGAPGGGNTISGNGNTGAVGSGILLEGSAVSPAPVVRANIIGLDPSGSAARGNTRDGVEIRTHDVVVGGPSPADRNVISGNLSEGVETAGASQATGALIEGNYIGLDATGSSAVGNGFYFGPANAGCCHTGIFVRTGNHVVRGNVVSGNWLGIRSGDSGGSANLIENNLVGTDANGTGNVGNQTDGIGLFGDKSGTQLRGNTIRFNGTGVVMVEGTENALLGGTGAGDGNLISDNGGHGVRVGYNTAASDIRNTIRSNEIVDNGGRGIDLAGNGVTANDPLDIDTGPNDLVNYPELLSALNGVVVGSTRLQVRLMAAANTQYDVEFFASATCDGSGFGEGGTPLLLAAATTDGGGELFYSVDVSTQANGTVITATATDPAGNTSEFSACEAVVAAPPAPSFTISAILPGQAAAGFGQMITVDGAGFPASPTVQFTQGATTLNGFVFSASATRLVLRLPTSGLASSPAGVPTDVTVTSGLMSSNVVTIPVSTTPGTPQIIQLYEASWGAPCGGVKSVSDGLLTLDAAGAISVQAHGFDTSAAQIQIVQGGNTWTQNSGCAFFAPVAHVVPLPASGAPGDAGGFLATGAAQIRVRTQVSGVWSAWSAATNVTLGL